MATTAAAPTLIKSTTPNIKKTTTKKTTKPKAGNKITAVKMPQTSTPSIPGAAEPIRQTGPKSGASNMLNMVSTHYIII